MPAQPSNRFTFFGADAEQTSGFGSSAFSASGGFGGVSSGFSSLASQATSNTFGSGASAFGAVAMQSTQADTNVDNDHSVPGAPDGVSSTTEENTQN